MRVNGIDAVLLDREGVKRLQPHLNWNPDARFRIYGGLFSPVRERRGTMRWPGALPAPPMPMALISSKIVR